jgi:SMODS and SLOG-associating 2TM effector domain family 5
LIAKQVYLIRDPDAPTLCEKSGLSLNLRTVPVPPIPPIDIEKEKQQLLRELKTTKGSRFNAAQRLGRRDKLLNRMIAFISGCVIVVTLLPVYFPVGPTATSAVSFFTIAFSIFILAMSLLQYSNSDPVRAEQHHRCGLELNSLRRELRSTHVTTEEQLIPFARRFDEILGKYSINHEDIDFERYKREHLDEYPDAARARDDNEAPVEWWVRIAGSLSAAATAALIAAVASSQLPTMVAYLRSLFH